jgi:ABC-type antimicrobial peptide transport system permease subunit
VARRTNEIGVRMAMGAGSRDIVRMVLRESLGMVGAGILIGLPCAYAIGRLLKTALYGLTPMDPITTGLSLAALVAVAIAAAWVPARRAAGIDPIVALREQ